MSQIDHEVSPAELSRFHSDSRDSDTSSNSNIAAENTNNQKTTGTITNLRGMTTSSSRTPLKMTKNVLNKINENNSSMESNENNNSASSNRKISVESIRLAERCLKSRIGEDEVTTDSVSSLNKNMVASSSFIRGEKQGGEAKCVPHSDCDSEFTIKMELEDKSLEDFNRVINQNKNLVLNWDYVQSSDYL